MNTTSSPSPSGGRLVFLDWLRIAAFALLVPFHVGMYYVTWGWHVKSPHASHAIEPLMMLSSPWRLSLLFLIAGAASAALWQRSSAGGFVRSRSSRLLWPLLFGMAVIVPPQPYLEVIEKLHYPGSYLDFLRLYFSAYHGFCQDGCLILPTWNHLWFVAYLWVYTVVLAALLRWRPQAIDAAACFVERHLHGARLLLVPIAALALVRTALVARFPDTHALVDDWFNHAHYFGLFLFGVMLWRAPAVWPRFVPLRWLALSLALACWAFVMLYFKHYAEVTPPEWLRQLQRVAFSTMQWGAISAALGFAVKHWNRDHPWRRTLTEAVFPLYILHQTVIVVLAHALKPADLSPALEAPLLIVAAYVLSFAGYLAARRVPGLCVCMGLSPAPKAGALTAPSAAAGRPLGANR
jgi:hypothetical protein